MVMREWLAKSPLIAILRGIRPDEIEGVCRVLLEEGIRIAEVPLNSPEPLRSIQVAASAFGEEMLVGAGTVTNVDEVQGVFKAGGKLIVSPDANAEVVKEAKRLGMFSLPGVATATEAFAMVRAGADGLKLFPADALGHRTVAAFRAVLPKGTMLIPEGGVDARSIAEWKRCGVDGFGVGSSLYKPGRSAEEVRVIARELVRELR
jgi:2-dehydro-3-deoxyphosphogalactonate aldolase